MRYRKLRIAWSAGWGLLAVILIVLWARSYWCQHLLRLRATQQATVVTSSEAGGLFLSFQRWGLRERWDFDFERLDAEDVAEFKLLAGPGGFDVTRDGLGISASFPHWFALLVVAAIATVPWIRWRFSLRTLLIATALVAVGLGLIVWLRQAG